MHTHKQDTLNNWDLLPFVQIFGSVVLTFDLDSNDYDQCNEHDGKHQTHNDEDHPHRLAVCRQEYRHR